MTLPAPVPAAPAPGRQRRSLPALVAGILMLTLVAAAGLFGYRLGLAQHQVPLWDPLVLRAALRRPADQSLPGPGPWVAAYHVPYDTASLRAVQARAASLDQVVAFAYSAGPDGTLQGEDPEILTGAVRGEKMVLLVANTAGGSFSTGAVRTLLASPAARQTAIGQIVARVEKLGAAGAQVDFEGVPASQRQEFTTFIQDLARALQTRGRTLSVAVPAKTGDNPGDPWSGAFDYAALGAAADFIYIMAYDQHYMDGPPGPVAGLPWTERVVRYAVFTIPAGKIVLGIPGYGYDWGKSDVRARGWPRMRQHLQQMQADIRWDSEMAENVATYHTTEPRVAWFPDGRSVAAKLKLAQAYNLRGIALWRLGFEDDEYWAQAAAFRSARR